MSDTTSPSPSPTAATHTEAADFVVAANRLPVQVLEDGTVVQSPGGLVSALSSLTRSNAHWVGWLGADSGPGAASRIADPTLHAVELEPDIVRGHYEGFCNSLLWPLFHGRLQPLELSREWWQAYRSANLHFATTIAEVAAPGGIAWIHDYHLLLVPAMLRARRPDLRIGSFLHIPFPSAQLFGTLPWRREILLGMSDADLLGFQTDDDVANFRDAWSRFGGTSTMRTPSTRTPSTEPESHPADEGGVPHAEAFPISIDYRRWNLLGEQVAEQATRVRHDLHVDTLFVGVDRLDYTKGIAQRLRAFKELLDEGELDATSCAFVQVAVPSRDDAAGYQEEREAVEHIVDEIGTRHARPDGSSPITYIDHALDEQSLAIWYRAADVLVITSFADGMNLVAKEFVATRGDHRGVVALSEFAGAAGDLAGALMFNPYDTDGIKRALLEAHRMPAVEQARRMTDMRALIQTHDVDHWANDFVDRLDLVTRSTRPMRARLDLPEGPSS